MTEPTSAFAAQSGDFTYSISNSSATITGYTGAGGEVAIPDILEGYPVKIIGSYAFEDSTAITGITVPNSVTDIDHSAFNRCTGLLGVKIGNHVIQIGEYAFAYCSGLKSVTIPKSVTRIYRDAFYECSGLTRIDVNKGNAKYSSSYGVLFNKSKTSILRYPANKTGKYTIPYVVKKIGWHAFHNCKDLTAVSIPNTVKTIDWGAFQNCTKLKHMVIPNSVTIIAYQAFYECSGLVDIKIGNHVTSIAELAFGNCTGIKSVIIPASVTEIRGNAFYGCSGLGKVFFLGNAPDMYSEFQADHPDDEQGTDVVLVFAFNNCPTNIRFYYINGKTGFKKSLQGYKSSTFPTINPVTDESTTISGISISSKDIIILVGSKTYYTKTNNAGKWSKVLTKELSAGTKITAKVTINGTTVASKTIIVTS
jgi:hypothetical protein